MGKPLHGLKFEILYLLESKELRIPDPQALCPLSDF